MELLERPVESGICSPGLREAGGVLSQATVSAAPGSPLISVAHILNN